MQNPRWFRKQCGALALPGKKPGCVVVVGIVDTLEIYLIDEFEDWDCRKLVQKCFHFDEIHGPSRWLADADHGALRGVLYEMNQGRGGGQGIYPMEQGIYPITPGVIRDAYEQPYLYILSEIKRLRDSERRLLHIDEDSAVLRYMAEISPEEMADLSLGAYPVLEAVAFAAIEEIQIAKAALFDYQYNSKDDEGVTDLLAL